MSGFKRTPLEKIKSLCYLTMGGTVAFHVIYIKKDFSNYYKNIIQPCNNYINPELSHKAGVFATKYGFFPKEKYNDPPVLSTKLLSYSLKNPIGVAAGFDKDGDAIKGLKHLGFSLIEIGSITPEPQGGNPKPRVFRLPEDKAVINRYGFNSEGHNKVHEKLLKLDKAELRPSILGINLGKNKNSDDAVKDYILGIEKFSNVADYFVINVSSPNTPGLRDLQECKVLEKLLTEVNRVREEQLLKPPLFLKLSPDLTYEEQKNIARVIMKKSSKVDGLIISNTTVNRDNLINKEESKETGGLSGRPLANKSTEMIRDMYKLTKGSIPIIGVGGIFNGKDAFDKILAGATALQIYTAFIYGGPSVITRIKSELSDLLTQNGYENVRQAVGKGV